MSAHIERHSHPLMSQPLMGLWNGVLYRIDPEAAGGMVAITPPQVQARITDRTVTPLAVSPVAAPIEAKNDPIIVQARAEATAKAALLFRRDGSEPLRVGHPDLWALLVAGTSLDGCPFPRT